MLLVGFIKDHTLGCCIWWTVVHLPELGSRLATDTVAMLDQARLVPLWFQANTLTLLLRSGLKPWWMVKSGGACRQSPWLPLTTKDILL